MPESQPTEIEVDRTGEDGNFCESAASTGLAPATEMPKFTEQELQAGLDRLFRQAE